MASNTHKPIRVGILGVGRGMHLAETAEAAGLSVVALCDTWESKLIDAGRRMNAATYTDFDRFLEHDTDGVIVANYAHQHAPYAIRAMEAGKHVMSETLACKTPAEGVALARAVERTGRIYMFAENYAYFAYVQEMRRLYRAGEIGEVQYAEGEYNHPMDARFYNTLAPGMNHWRNHLAPTYYPTHAISPIMYVTDTRPVSVNALSVARSVDDSQLHVRRDDVGAVIICRMDNGSVARLMGFSFRGHAIWYRFHGTRGLMENLRTGSPEMLRVVHEEWDLRPGESPERIYRPRFPVAEEIASAAGHGGGDFFVNFHFAEAIRRNEQPYMDVYRAVAMSLIAPQAWRSCLNNGAPFEIPDFRDESVRQRYETDDFSPFPEDRKPGQPVPYTGAEPIPNSEAIAYARKVWDEMGYRGE
jgi:predicted dehydrogenase